MLKVTMESLAKGAKILGIEVTKKMKEKDIEAAIKKALEAKVLDAECPECGNDIPDEMTSCPFCGVSFEDDDADNTEDTNDNDPATLGEEDQTGEEDTDNSEGIEAPKEEKAKEKAKDKAPKEEKPAKEKGPKVKINENTAKLMAEVDKVVGKDKELEIRDRSVLYSVFRGEERICSVMKNAKNITLYLCTENEVDVEGFTSLTAEEAKAKHLGRIRGIYDGTDLKAATQILKESINYKG